MDLHKQLLSQCEEMNILLREQILVKDKLIYNLEEQIATWHKENTLDKKEIKKMKTKNTVVIVGAAALLVGILILK